MEFLINILFKNLFNDFHAGHLGRDKTYQKFLDAGYYYSGLYTQVEIDCNTCDYCQRINIKGSKKEHKPIQDNSPYDIISIDSFTKIAKGSDFIVYSSKPLGYGNYRLHKEPISIHQYLFDNIFTSPLTSIRHYKINIKESKQLKLIFNLILNNIFKLQLYSLTFKINKNKLVG
ncbi:hypothetical protein ACTFIY_008741 [Dictyostelium cf. discoideum]